MSGLHFPVDARDHVQGPEDAPVTLVEYGDFECPYCGEAYPLIKAVQREMGARLRFIFRHFPITDAHPHAGRAAELAEAAAGIGRFWPMHDLLYENQGALDDVDLIAYGERLGLSRAAISEAFGGLYDEHIRRDFMGGVRSGVNGTPTLFINGQRYDGEREVSSIVAALNAAAA